MHPVRSLPIPLQRYEQPWYIASLLVTLEFCHRCKILAWVFAVQLDSLLLTVVSFFDSRPLRPRIGGGTRSSESSGMISSCATLLQPCRDRQYPTQSVPVSPPPTTTTFLPSALMKHSVLMI